MIVQKKKICLGCESEQYIFSRGLCKMCAAKTPKPKSKLKESTPKPLYKVTGELALFQSIWATRPHTCSVCDKKLHDFQVGFFSHILTKNAFPRFRLFAENIVIKCLDCHRLYEHKTNNDLIKMSSRWVPIVELHDLLITKYYER